jgi:hypothetical protein
LVNSLEDLVSKTKKQRLISDLNIIKNATITHKNLYGKWPKNTGVLLKKGLVKFDKTLFRTGEEIINEFGYPYSIIKDIRGNMITTTFKDKKSPIPIQIKRRFTPAYKAKTEARTVFLQNFELKDTEELWASDYPLNLLPGVDGDGDGTIDDDEDNGSTMESGHAGVSGAGQSAYFTNNPFSEGFTYPVKMPKFKELTVEFWVRFKNPLDPLFGGGRNNVFSVLGNDPSNGGGQRTFEINFGDDNGPSTNIEIVITGPDTYNNTPNMETQIIYDFKDYLDITNPKPEFINNWHHFAVVYYYDNFESKLKLFINGDEIDFDQVDLYDDGDNLLLNSTTPTKAEYYFPLSVNNMHPKWERKLYVGSQAQDGPSWEFFI